MADIAIFRINYKSDFILTLNSDAGWLTPFCIKFWTGAPSQAYYAYYDGMSYTHCAPVEGEPTKLLVQFDDHHLPIGDLKFQIGYHFTVDDFPTTVEDEVINQASVIIEVDNAPAQVMLDLNGETAPEIEFSLPAYANEAQRIANEEQRIAHEAIRIVNEESRIAAETIRQQNEAQRISNEESRVEEFAQMKQESETATADANAAASLANEKAQLAADKAALAVAAATLANDKAALAQQKAEYAQTQGDYAKAQGDYAKQQGEIAEEDHERAEADHTRAESDHATAGSDHTQAGTDHTQAGTDHTRAESDHTRAESDHAAVELYVDSLGAFDISAYHATGGVLAKYADLTAALGTNGANIPEAIRKGGMSVKFVLSSDNKYVQYRLMSDSFNTTTSNWQGVSGKLIAGSKDLAESGAILKDIFDSSYQNDIEISWTNEKFYYKEYGKIVEGSVAGFKAAKIDVSQYIGQSLKINCICSDGQPSTRARNAVTDSEDNVLLELNTTPDRNPEYITVPEGSKYLYLSYWIELNITEGYVKKGGDINSVIKNLLVGNRYLGLLEQAGAVSTPASTNTFYLASGAGTYNFADNSSFVLKDKEIGIFLFSESGIEKKKISSYTNFWDENNLINYNTLTPNKYIDYTNGSVGSIQGLFASDYIEVIPGEYIQITLVQSSWGAFYDGSKNFVSKNVPRNNNGMANVELQVPDNAKYMRLTVNKDNILTKLYRSKGMYPIKMSDIPSVVIQSSVFDNDCNFADTPVEGKKADVTSGTIIDDSSKKYVKCLIPSGADIVSINILPDSIAWGTSGNTITGSIEPTLEIHRPEGATRFNLFLNFGINDDISTLQCLCVKSVVVEYSMQGLKVPYLEEEIGRLGTEVRNQWKDKKILWLGTSIPWGQSDEDEPGTHRVAHPYPQQVCAALGATLVDSTHGGLAQMADYNSEAQLWVPKNYGSTCLTSAECVAAYNAGLTSSDKSAFSFENTLLGKNADLYVFDVEPNNAADGSLDDLALFNWYTWQYTNGTSIASHRNTYIGALIYEIDKLLTEKSDAIIVFIGEFLNMKSNTYQDEYDVRTASRQLCEKFHIHYIDLSEKLMYVGKNKNVWLNSDMIHPKRATYDRIAKMLINELLLIA